MVYRKDGNQMATNFPTGERQIFPSKKTNQEKIFYPETSAMVTNKTP